MVKNYCIFTLIIIMIFSIALADIIIAEKPLSKDKVLNDFKRMYRIPADNKILKTRYIGNLRNFIEDKTDYSSLQVGTVNLFSECGLIIDYIWEVQYKKINEKWLFHKVSLWSHKKINNHKEEHPDLDKKIAKILITRAFTRGNNNVSVENIKILTIKKKWNFCSTEYKIQSKVKISSLNNNIRTLYECPISSKISLKNNKWALSANNCIMDSGEYSCYFDTMCKNLGTQN